MLEALDREHPLHAEVPRELREQPRISRAEDAEGERGKHARAATVGQLLRRGKWRALRSDTTAGIIRLVSHVTAATTYQFSVEEYHKLGEAGIFHEDDRVELLNGDIVIMAPIGIRHIKAVRRLIRSMSRHFADRCTVDAQNPVMIDGHSEPQPDILLLRATADTRETSPLPEDVLLLLEVADSSLLYDQRDKLEAYARNGIVEYWLLDLTRNELHVFRDPEGCAYRTTLVVRADESIAPLAFADTPVAVSEILPP